MVRVHDLDPTSYLIVHFWPQGWVGIRGLDAEVEHDKPIALHPAWKAAVEKLALYDNLAKFVWVNLVGRLRIIHTRGFLPDPKQRLDVVADRPIEALGALYGPEC